VISPEQFGRALVERLAPILPAGFAAHADSGAVQIDAPDGFGSATHIAELLDRDDLLAEDYATAAWTVLSMAQDVVSETTTDPWPSALGPGGDLAEPGTKVDGAQIHLWFGAEDQPVLTLPPIEIEVRSER
jgi:hypothetical protein